MRQVLRGGLEAVIVETMGYDALYHERKARTRALMRRVLGGALLVSHDFHQPADQPQPQHERDRRFWLEYRWTVTGLEMAGWPRRCAVRRTW